MVRDAFLTNYGGEETLKEHLFLKLQFFTVLFIITLQPTFPRYCHFTKENFDRLVALWIAEVIRKYPSLRFSIYQEEIFGYCLDVQRLIIQNKSF